MLAWIQRLLNRNTAPVVVPAPEPVVVTAPARVIRGIPVDTRSWTGVPTSDWEWYDRRTTYNGYTNEALTSGKVLAKEGQVVTAEADVVSSGSWGDRVAKGAVVVTPYRADGRSIGHDNQYIVPISEGTFTHKVTMPAGTDHYKVALMPQNTTQSGTYDPAYPNSPYTGEQLKVSFINLTIETVG